MSWWGRSESYGDAAGLMGESGYDGKVLLTGIFHFFDDGPAGRFGDADSRAGFQHQIEAGVSVIKRDVACSPFEPKGE